MLNRSRKPAPIRFGEFEADLAARQLRRRGIRLRVQQKPFAILSLLLERPGEVITREEIRERLWAGDTFVDFEHGVNTALRRLRSALCDSAEKPTWIETVPRSGYRFIGKIEGYQAREQEPIRGRIPTIAVLPFANLSQDSSQEYLADGVTEEIIASLAKLSGLNVISRTSVILFKEARVSLPEIARELKADVIVEGSVARAGDVVRITAQLIDGKSDTHLWAETYRSTFREILELQSEIARSIAEHVQAKVTAEEYSQLLAKRVVDPRAYELYLQGRFWWNKRPLAGAVQRAMAFFTQAIEQDSSFALPHVGIADSYNTLAAWESGLMAPDHAYPLARAAATHALATDTNLAEAHTSLAYAELHFGWDWKRAEQEFKRALRLNGNYAHCRHWYSHYLIAMGRLEESLEESLRIIELDPHDLIINVHLAWHYFMARQNESAIEQSNRTLHSESAFHWGYFFRGLAMEQLGEIGKAIESLRKAVELSGGSTVMESALAHAYATAKEHAAAREILDSLKVRSKERYISSYEIALIHAALGETESAVDWLERAQTERSGWLPYLNCEPRLDGFRGHPRFKQLVQKLGLPAVDGKRSLPAPRYQATVGGRNSAKRSS